MVLVLLLLPFLCFLNGVQVETQQHFGENAESNAVFSVKRTAEAWYDTGRCVREPEHGEKRNVTTEIDACVDTDTAVASRMETWESTQTGPGQGKRWKGRDDRGLRAPPVFV